MPMEDKLISKFVRFPLTMNVYITNRYPINVYISGNWLPVMDTKTKNRHTLRCPTSGHRRWLENGELYGRYCDERTESTCLVWAAETLVRFRRQVDHWPSTMARMKILREKKKETSRGGAEPAGVDQWQRGGRHFRKKLQRSQVSPLQKIKTRRVQRYVTINLTRSS